LGQALRLETFSGIVGCKHLLGKCAIALSYINRRAAFVADDRCQATCFALSATASRAAMRPTIRSVSSDRSFSSPRPITRNRFAGLNPLGGVNRKCFAVSPANSPAIAQARQEPVEFLVGFLRRALVGIAQRGVLEEANDLEIGRLHVWADHLMESVNPERLGGEDVSFGAVVVSAANALPADRRKQE